MRVTSTVLVLGAALILTAAGVAPAQSSGGDFALGREVVAGGGARAEGGDFSAVATTAQHALGTAAGGDFVLHGGFHAALNSITPPGEAIFADGFEE